MTDDAPSKGAWPHKIMYAMTPILHMSHAHPYPSPGFPACMCTRAIAQGYFTRVSTGAHGYSTRELMVPVKASLHLSEEGSKMCAPVRVHVKQASAASRCCQHSTGTHHKPDTHSTAHTRHGPWAAAHAAPRERRSRVNPRRHTCNRSPAPVPSSAKQQEASRRQRVPGSRQHMQRMPSSQRHPGEERASG